MTRRRPLAALALAALISAGCADEPAGSGGAARAEDPARTKAVRFAECMRENGVAEFPDPDASGELTADGVLNGSSLDPDDPVWDQAMAACEDIQPAGFTGEEEVTDEDMRARLEFARCMRENGVADFPDPVEGQPLVDTRRIPSTDRPGGMGVLDAAMATCGDLAPRSVRGR